LSGGVEFLTESSEFIFIALFYLVMACLELVHVSFDGV
jgi:hypothetical protein